MKKEDIGIVGGYKVRDLWRQKDTGSFDNTFESEVPFHGVILLRMTPVK